MEKFGGFSPEKIKSIKGQDKVIDDKEQALAMASTEYMYRAIADEYSEYLKDPNAPKFAQVEGTDPHRSVDLNYDISEIQHYTVDQFKWLAENNVPPEYLVRLGETKAELENARKENIEKWKGMSLPRLKAERIKNSLSEAITDFKLDRATKAAGENAGNKLASPEEIANLKNDLRLLNTNRWDIDGEIHAKTHPESGSEFAAFPMGSEVNDDKRRAEQYRAARRSSLDGTPEQPNS